jgi:hypothetical protein
LVDEAGLLAELAVRTAAYLSCRLGQRPGGPALVEEMTQVVLSRLAAAPLDPVRDRALLLRCAIYIAEAALREHLSDNCQ